MTTGQRYVSKNLSELLESFIKAKWDRPINLSVFDKTANVHSTLALMNLSVNKRPFEFRGIVSFVYVNMRLVYASAYKAIPVDGDVEKLREFTRKWTASIIAVNEVLSAKVH